MRDRCHVLLVENGGLLVCIPPTPPSKNPSISKLSVGAIDAFGDKAHNATATVLLGETDSLVKGMRHGKTKGEELLTSSRYNQGCLDGRGISSGVCLIHKRIQ